MKHVMRYFSWPIGFAVLMLLFGPPAAGAQAPASDPESLELTSDQETIDWLKSWGIKRNPDGSLSSMSPAELEEYWRQRELNETERQARREKLEAVLQEQIQHDRELLEKNPQDPDVHFQIAIHSQNRGDGEGAIIHMLKAEELYKAQKDIRGMARARKALREYYQTYGYLPEDFDLNR